MKTKLILPVVLMLSGMSFAHASEQNKEPQEPVETIEVRGKRPLKFYLDQYRQHETAFYDMYNELVDDKDFRIHCSTEQKVASNMKQRVCEPKFVSDIKYDVTQRGAIAQNGALGAGANVSAGFTNSEVRKRVEEKNMEMAGKMVALVNANPELMQKYQNLQQAKFAYDSRKSGN